MDTVAIPRIPPPLFAIKWQLQPEKLSLAIFSLSHSFHCNTSSGVMRPRTTHPSTTGVEALPGSIFGRSKLEEQGWIGKESPGVS